MPAADSVNSTSAFNSTRQTYYLSQIILSLITAGPAVLSNVVLLLSVYRDPDRNRLRQSPVTLLVVNLSVCDLLAGLAPGFGSSYYYIALFNGTAREDLNGMRILLTFCGVITTVVSSCTITAMSFDRLFAVSSPLQYKAQITNAKIKVFLAICWVYALLFSCLVRGVSFPVFVLLYCHLHISFPLVILPVTNWKTYRVLRSHNNLVRDIANNGRQAMVTVHRNRERKLMSAFFLVLVLFYATFMPVFIAQNMFVFRPSWLKSESFSTFLSTSDKFVLVNCILNPFIYAWRIPKYRRAFKAVFCGCGFRNQPTNTVADGISMTMRRPRSTTGVSFEAECRT